MGSHKVAGNFDSKIIRPNGIDSGCFKPQISQNVATSMPNLTRKSCGDSLLAVYLARQIFGTNKQAVVYKFLAIHVTVLF